MNTTPFALRLKMKFSEEVWPWVVLALRQDSFIWESLANSDFGAKALEVNRSDLEDWSPAALTLQSLREVMPIDGIRLPLLQSPGSEIMMHASQAYQNWLNSHAPFESLAQCGLAAIWVRGEWVAKPDFFDLVPQVDDRVESFKSLLACVYGMLPEPLKLMNALLLPKREGLSPDLAVHAQLCNPFSGEQHIGNFFSILKELPRDDSLEVLEAIENHRPWFSRRLAEKLSRVWAAEFTAKSSRKVNGLVDQIESLKAKVQLAEVHRLSGQPEKSAYIMSDSLKAVHRLQGDVAARSIKSILNSKGSSNHSASLPLLETALNAWKHSAPPDLDPDGDIPGMVEALLETGRLREAKALITGKAHDINMQKHPAFVLSIAKLAQKSENTMAARQVSRRALDMVKAGAPLKLADHLSLSRILYEVGLHEEACEAARIGLNRYPSNVGMLKVLSQASLQLGRKEDAVESAAIAQAAQTEDGGAGDGQKELTQLLIEGLEAAGEWESALRERTALLEINQPPSIMDFTELANCAIKAGNPERACWACRKAIALDSENVLGHELMARASALMGDYPSAIQHYQQATVLAPMRTDFWLSLAQTYKLNGQENQSLESLRAANLVLPENGEIHRMLGEAYLEQKAPSQALGFLRKAVKLAPDSQSTLKLGETLLQLGQIEEAKEILEQALADFDDSSKTADGSDQEGVLGELKYAYAKTWLASGNTKEAMPLLEEAVRLRANDVHAGYDLAKAMLQLDETPEAAGRAVQYLKNAAVALRDEPEAKAWLAEAYSRAGQHSAAYECFRQLMGTPLSHQPNWRSRITTGLCKVALRLDHPDTAVAVMQELIQAEPDNQSARKMLSEAYLASGLAVEALQSAKTLVDLSAQSNGAKVDVDTISWFADLGVRLYEQENISVPFQHELMQAIQHSIEQDPSRYDLVIKLGKMLQANGETDNARIVLKKLVAIDGTSPNINADDILHAARSLRELDEPQLAIGLLNLAYEKNVESSSDSPAGHSASSIEILEELAAAQQQSGKPEAAVETIQQAVKMDSSRADLYQRQAMVLEELGRLDEALECLKQALDLKPDDTGVRQQAAFLFEATGDLGAALDYVQPLLGSSVDISVGYDPRLLLLAGRVSYSMLRPRQALGILQQIGGEGIPVDDYCESLCLTAEAALSVGEMEAAGAAITRLQKISPSHIRLLAAQARWFTRQGDLELGLCLLKEADQALRNTPSGQHAALTGDQKGVYPWDEWAVGEAALELHQWDIGERRCRRTPNYRPNPLASLKFAQLVVQQAETQALCNDLEVIEHAPGAPNLSEQSRLIFEEAVQEAQDLAAPDPPPWQEIGASDSMGEAVSVLRLWTARGRAVFQPSETSARTLEEVVSSSFPASDELAALVMVYRRAGLPEKAVKAAQAEWIMLPTGVDLNKTYGVTNHPLVSIQLALALEVLDIKKSLQAASDCLEKIIASACQWPEQPMGHFLVARVAFRADEGMRAYDEINKALEMWPGEPRWHLLATEIALAMGLPDLSVAQNHLQQAACVGSACAPVFIRLGCAQLERGEIDRAVESFSQASQLAPDNPDAWMWLARAYQAAGDLEQAASSAEQALDKSLDPQQALLLRGEIALQANNPRGALGRAQTILRTQPNHLAALHLLSQAMEKLDRPEDALLVLEKAIQLVDSRSGKGSQDVLELQVERLQLIRKYHGLDRAESELNRLIEQHPGDTELQAILAEWLLESGKTDAALHVARQALQSGKEQLGEARLARLNFLVGQQLRRSGQLDQAIAHLSACLTSSGEGEPHEAQDPAIRLEACLELGKVYQERREFRHALKVYQKAIQLSPEDYRAYFQAGVACKDGKDYLAAEAMLRRAAQLAPHEVAIHRLLGAVVALNLVHNRKFPQEQPTPQGISIPQAQPSTSKEAEL